MNELISELHGNAYSEVNINEVEVEIIAEFETAK